MTADMPFELRAAARALDIPENNYGHVEMVRDAADEIERLTAERDRLREALGDVAALADRGVAWSSFTRQKVLDVCAAALGESPVPDEPPTPSHPTGEERTDGV